MMKQLALEVWRDIPTYEGRYQISNLKQVKRVFRSPGKRYGMILKPRGQTRSLNLYHQNQAGVSYRLDDLYTAAFVTFGSPIPASNYSRRGRVKHVGQKQIDTPPRLSRFRRVIRWLINK